MARWRLGSSSRVLTGWRQREAVMGQLLARVARPAAPSPGALSILLRDGLRSRALFLGLLACPAPAAAAACSCLQAPF